MMIKPSQILLKSEILSKNLEGSRLQENATFSKWWLNFALFDYNADRLGMKNKYINTALFEWLCQDFYAKEEWKKNFSTNFHLQKSEKWKNTRMYSDLKKQMSLRNTRAFFSAFYILFSLLNHLMIFSKSKKKRNYKLDHMGSEMKFCLLWSHHAGRLYSVCVNPVVFLFRTCLELEEAIKGWSIWVPTTCFTLLNLSLVERCRNWHLQYSFDFCFNIVDSKFALVKPKRMLSQACPRSCKHERGAHLSLSHDSKHQRKSTVHPNLISMTYIRCHDYWL